MVKSLRFKGRICGFQPLREETPKAGKVAPLPFRLSLRAIQPLPETDLKCLGGICDAENVVQYAA